MLCATKGEVLEFWLEQSTFLSHRGSDPSHQERSASLPNPPVCVHKKNPVGLSLRVTASGLFLKLPSHYGFMVLLSLYLS